MRLPPVPTGLLAALVIAGALIPAAALAQQKSQPQAQPKAEAPKAQPQGQPQQGQAQQGQPQAPAAPKPYKPVAVQPPKPVADPSFEAFRKQLAAVAQKKDRTALSRLVAQKFFWIPNDNDVADKGKSGIDNLAKAIGLDGRDSPGWEMLAAFADEPTADPDPQRAGVICGPGEATFDEKAAEELANATETDPSEWGYPSADGVEVRSGPEPTSPVSEKLGMHLVRVYPDDSPSAAVHAEMLRIVTPAGKIGFVGTDFILPLASDQLCYAKEGNAWKIAGAVGGAAPAP